MSTSLSVRKLADQLQRRTNRTSNRLTGWLRKAMLDQLANLTYGELTLVEGDEVYRFSGEHNQELRAEIKILDAEFYWYVALGGSGGAGEAYINHYWQSEDLTKVIQLFALNQSVMDSMEGGLAKITSPVKKAFHWLNKNTRQGSKSNIVAHYDLGNEFFQLFLDPTLMYSAGIFLNESESMHQASLNKLERICQRLRLQPTDQVVEIGTGWGSFAIYAAKHYGCRVTTTTISDAQYQYAAARIKEEGLGHKITLLKEDYRNLRGQFDKLVSIEMIEAVGHQYYDTFFAQCSKLLKPEGEMLLQAITINDQRFDSAKKEVDFIKRYIFPGSCIPSVDVMSRSLRQSTDMRILNLEDIGIHYALTLKRWREAFFKQIAQVRAQGFSEAFIRMWEFYFCYCEGGFRERVISVVQMHQVKPRARVPMTLTHWEK